MMFSTGAMECALSMRCANFDFPFFVFKISKMLLKSGVKWAVGLFNTFFITVKAF